jgi:drug/metabolite transporter (DMT)-like permease
MTDKRSGVMWILVSALAYSLFTVMAKRLLDEIGPTDVLFWRFVIATPVIWVAVLLRARSRRGPNPLHVEWHPRFAMGLLFGLLAWFAFVGVDKLPGDLYVIIIYTYPAMVALGARLLGKPATRQLWTALGIITIGIAFTVPEIFDGSQDAALFGFVLTLFNAALYAGYILYSERIVNDTKGHHLAGDSFVAAAWGMVGSLIVATVVALASGGVSVPDTGLAVACMFGLGIISTVVSQTAFFLGVSKLGPAPAALVAASEPVMALTWLVLFLDESMRAIQIAGAALVIVGVVWSQWVRPEPAAK